MCLDRPGSKSEPFPELECVAVAQLVVDPNLLDALIGKPPKQHPVKMGADALPSPASVYVRVVNQTVSVRQDHRRALGDAPCDESEDLFSVAGDVCHCVAGCEKIQKMGPQVVFCAGRRPPDRVDRLDVRIELPGQSSH